MEDIFTSIEKVVSGMFTLESSGHYIYHLKRVFNAALHMQSIEGGDRIVIGAAALLHDVHRLIAKETGSFCSPRDSLDSVAKLINQTSLPTDKINNVLHCIEYNEEYSFSDAGKTMNDLETLILQDADNLDAIGAIGIGRTFSFGGAYGIPMWVVEKPFDRHAFDESVKDPSTIHHFYSKLLKLKANMHTRSGAELAEKRHKFMELFL
jgi:uncharacterized protein